MNRRERRVASEILRVDASERKQRLDAIRSDCELKNPTEYLWGPNRFNVFADMTIVIVSEPGIHWGVQNAQRHRTLWWSLQQTWWEEKEDHKMLKRSQVSISIRVPELVRPARLLRRAIFGN